MRYSLVPVGKGIGAYVNRKSTDTVLLVHPLFLRSLLVYINIYRKAVICIITDVTIAAVRYPWMAALCYDYISYRNREE